MIPGVSRSMATNVGGMAQKMTRKAAAKFFFLPGCSHDVCSYGLSLLKLFLDGGTEIIMNNLPALIIGNVVAFVVALLAIKIFISFVTKYGFKAFRFRYRLHRRRNHSSAVAYGTQFRGGVMMDFKEGEVLYFNKPLGWTSFKVVGHARYHICRRMKVKKLKVGHAGTLDPLRHGSDDSMYGQGDEAD